MVQKKIYNNAGVKGNEAKSAKSLKVDEFE